ncbi:MAG: hypothetical protein LBL87_05675 [Ruminococcus sp.]|jgi:hypothetical protein|nr:hypothetical protein [Ruminococcus sp.]
MTAKILALYMIVISLCFPVPSPGYNPTGTGEAGFVSYKMPEKINFLQSCAGNVDYPPNIDRLDPRFFTLDGVLTNSELEAEINDFIMDSVRNFGSDHSLASYITALNGYIEVAVDYGHMDGNDYSNDGIIAIWNMKTGERLTKFSDMFYKGKYFLPAVISAERNYNKDDTLTIDKEPEKFSMIALLSGSYKFTENEIDDIPARDLPLYAMSDAWGFMPMWQYYDMSDMFTGKTQLTRRTLIPRDFYPHKYTQKSEADGKLSATYIASSLYLSNAEINRRNAELKEIYKAIKASKEYEKYPSGKYDIIYTSIDFDGDLTTVTTDVGTFGRNSKTGKIFTPENCKLLDAKENFRGFVDIDIDGEPEIISVYNESEIRIYNSDLSLKKTIPIGYSDRRSLPLMWYVTKTGKNVMGEIFIVNVFDEMKSLEYKNDEFGKFEKTMAMENARFKEYEASIAEADYFFTEDGFSFGVVYSGKALDYSETQYLSGTALDDFEKIKKAAYTGEKNITVADRNKNGVHLAVWRENELLINGVSVDYETYDENPSYSMSVHTTAAIKTSGSVYVPEKRTLESAFTAIDFSDGLNGTFNPLFILKENGFEEISPISRNSYFFAVKDGDITAVLENGGIVGYKDRTDLIGAEPGLPYWFRGSNENYYGYYVPFAEYGGIDFPIEDFRKMKGGAAILEEIEEGGGKLINILYRDNGIININYKEPVQEGSDWVYYKYKTYRDIYEAYGRAEDVNKPLQFVDEGHGTYVPSITAVYGEDLSKFNYPDELPYGGYWWLDEGE